MFTDRLIINSPHLKENKTEFLIMIENFRSEFLPMTVTEDLLVQQMAVCFWRMRRLITAETSQILNQLEDIEDSWGYKQLVKSLVNDALDLGADEGVCHPHDDADRDVCNAHDDEGDNVGTAGVPTYSENSELEEYIEKQVGLKSIPDVRNSRHLLLYELRLDRQLTRKYRMLERLQKVRREREERLERERAKQKRENLKSGWEL